MRYFAGIVTITLASAGFSQFPELDRINHGHATITRDNKKMQIELLENFTSIDWQTHNISPGNSVTVLGQGFMLNRISGGQSSIQGTYAAPDALTVMWFNPDGFYFSKKAIIDCKNFIASAANFSDHVLEEFAITKDKLYLEVTNPHSRIENHGRIGKNGITTLVAPIVSNYGTISAHKGIAKLNSGSHHVIDFSGDQLVSFAIKTDEIPESRVENFGEIYADGGKVQITATDAANTLDNVVNSTGIISARSIGVNQQGNIEVFADNVSLSGKVDISSAQPNNKGGEKVHSYNAGTMDITANSIDMNLLDIDARTGPGGSNAGKVNLYFTNNLNANANIDASCGAAHNVANHNGSLHIETTAVDLDLSKVKPLIQSALSKNMIVKVVGNKISFSNKAKLSINSMQAQLILQPKIALDFANIKNVITSDSRRSKDEPAKRPLQIVFSRHAVFNNQAKQDTLSTIWNQEMIPVKIQAMLQPLAIMNDYQDLSGMPVIPSRKDFPDYYKKLFMPMIMQPLPTPIAIQSLPTPIVIQSLPTPIAIPTVDNKQKPLASKQLVFNLNTPEPNTETSGIKPRTTTFSVEGKLDLIDQNGIPTIVATSYDIITEQ